jgi:hypothetical protein
MPDACCYKIKINIRLLPNKIKAFGMEYRDSKGRETKHGSRTISVSRICGKKNMFFTDILLVMRKRRGGEGREGDREGKKECLSYSRSVSDIFLFEHYHCTFC